MNVVELKKRRNPNPSLRDHEERLTEVEDFIAEIRGIADSIKRRLNRWGVVLLAGFAASGFIDERAIRVIKAMLEAMGAG